MPTLQALGETIEYTLFLFVRSMDSRISQDIGTLAELKRLQAVVAWLEQQMQVWVASNMSIAQVRP